METCEQDISAGRAQAQAQRPTAMPVRTGIGLLLCAAVLGLIRLDALWEGGFLYAAVGLAVVLVALGEFAFLAERAGAAASRAALLLGGAALFLAQWAGGALGLFDPWLGGSALVAVMTVGVLTAGVFRARLEGALRSTAVTVTGWIYVPAMLGFLTAIRLDRGAAGLITVLGVCKASSTGAYFTGRLVGGPKLMPRVSPKKTVAGAVGSAVAAVAVALALSRSPWSVMSPGAAPLYGLVVAAAALFGDLAESTLKREAGLKDSGRLLPGLGGMLDMLDDLLFAVPASFLFLQLGELLTAGG